MAEAFDWYEERLAGLGFEFLEQVALVQQQVEQNPLRHAVIYRNVRRALVRKFPYKVFYFIEENRVHLIGVVHVKRHPGFWQKRVK